MGRYFLPVLGMVFTLIACSNNDKRVGREMNVSDSIPAVKGMDLERRMALTDSLQLIYYDNPDGDSVRFSRYFQYTITKDPGTVQALLSAINTNFEERSNIKPCRSEGKIYAFVEEDPVKTFYFSTRGDTCSYLYFIKDGLFYYFSLTNELRIKLNEHRKVKVTPKAEQIQD
jgi:hypothetical protein